MIRRLVDFSLSMPVIVILFSIITGSIGVIAYLNLDIEAYPNPVPPLVEVITQPNGGSAEEVERYVTIPLEISLAGMPGLDHLRSQSLFGLSDVKCYFDWDTAYYDARQEVINRIQFASLPNGLTAQLSPWNAIGEVYRYTLRGRRYSSMDLKSIEDWILEKQFKRVPGVIDVTSFGGETRQYQVNVDPFKMVGMGVTLNQLTAAISNANINVGGQYLALGEQSYNVRGIGLIHNLGDIEKIVISEQKSVPVRVGDIARSEIGAAPRLGIVGLNDDSDVVQGIVLMRYGGQTLPTLRNLYRKLDEIKHNHLLPPGVEIVPYSDRGKLVKLTTSTVMENLIIGIVLVSIVLFFFLGNFKAAAITSINIPVALLIAFGGMVITNTPANLISLGAVDFGIIIDSTIIMMENISRHLGDGEGNIIEQIKLAASEVGTPMSFSTIIIGIAFLPLFTMTGVSGVIFAPMAHTYAFAISGAILLALTLTPVLASKFMRADEKEREGSAMRVLHHLYEPFFDAALKSPKKSMLFLALPILLFLALYPMLGGEFMPKLEEGNLWIRATLPQSISLEEATTYANRMRAILRGCPRDGNPCDEHHRAHPEIMLATSQVGRPDDGTDVTGFNNIEMFAPLIPLDDFPSGMTKEKLIETLSAELKREFPGAVFNFSQLISDNVEEALAGVKGENSVKVVGPNLERNEAVAKQILDVMNSIRGIRDLGMFPSLGQPNITITIDREACARYGLNTGDVAGVAQAAIGGQAVTQVYEGERFFDLVVRWDRQYRDSIPRIAAIKVATPDQNQIPLGQLAKIEKVEGPSRVFREDGYRYAPVKFSVRGRDLKSTIDEAQEAIARNVKLDYDQHLEWAGQISEFKDAMNRLLLIIPITIFIIGMLVYMAVRNWVDLIIVLANIPVAVTGGMLALLVTGIPLSVSAAMGFISIFGIAIQDAILIVTYFQRLTADGASVVQAAREAAEKRFRPVLMTTLVATLGLLPAAISNGIGAQTQKPLAVVVIGGSIILAVLTRVLQPPMLVLAHGYRYDRRNTG